MKKIIIGLSLLTLSSCSIFYKKVGGNFTHEPNEIHKLSGEGVEEMTSQENQIIDKCLKYSMTTKLRMWALINSINYISNKKRSPGQIQSE